MPSPTSPTVTLKVAGVAYDRVAGRVALERVVPYSRDGGAPTLEWSIVGGPMQPASDPFRGKAIELHLDVGGGELLGGAVASAWRLVLIGRERPIGIDDATADHGELRDD